MGHKSDWIDAKEGLQIVEKVLNGRKEAKAAIAECLRDGDLRSSAEKVWVSTQREIAKAWSKEYTRHDIQTNVILEAKIYRKSKRWGLDQEEWRWPNNKFSITDRASPTVRRVMLHGVKLCRSDINTVILRRASPGAGSPGKPETWVDLWCILIGMAQRNELHNGRFPTKASLEEAVLIQLDEALSDRAIGRQISQVYDRLIKGYFGFDHKEGATVPSTPDERDGPQAGGIAS